MPAPLNETATFTESSQALTAIVDQFRNQTLPLEEALALFEKGIGYVRTCQSTLGNAKGKLQTLSQALADVQQTTTQPEALTVEAPTAIPETPEKTSFTDVFQWHHQHLISNNALMLDEAWLKQLLLTIKAALPFQTQGLPKIYERENQSGLEAFLPLANGWLMVSVWKPKTTQQGKLQVQLQVAEASSLVAEVFSSSMLEEALATALA